MKLLYILLLASSVSFFTSFYASSSYMKDIFSAIHSHDEQKIHDAINRNSIDVTNAVFTSSHLSLIGLATQLKCSAAVKVALAKRADPNKFYMIDQKKSALAEVYALMLKRKGIRDLNDTKQIAVYLLQAGATCPEEESLITQNPTLKEAITEIKQAAEVPPPPSEDEEKSQK